MGKHHKSRKSHNKKTVDAYEQALQAEEKVTRPETDSEDEHPQTKYGGVVIDARALMKNGEVEALDDSQFEDEELDSDEAFGSSDRSEEEDLEGEFEGEVDDDAHLEYDNVDEGELMPLSALLGDEPEKKSAKEPKLVLDDNMDSDSESESDRYEEESSDEENPFDEVKNDEEEELTNVMSTLKKELPKKAKEMTALVNEQADENAYSLPTQGEGLSLEEMMAGVDGEEEETEKPFLLEKTAKVSSAPFSIPLPQNIQKRQETKAAYAIQKEEVAKWSEAVEANRRADVLKFGKEKNAGVKSSFAPTEESLNELESKLDAVMEASNAESKKTEDLFEQIETAQTTKEAMLERTRELRLMRELMYRGQKDSKRIKKIKSKAYHRQLKKQRLREKKLVEEAEGGEEEEDSEVAAFERARERMTLRHKNNSSKWAKSMLKSGLTKDASNREEMEEMLRRGESLRKKQLGRKDEEDSDEYDERDEEEVRKDLEKEETEEESAVKDKLGKGVLGMQFMRAAEERQRQRNREELAEMNEEVDFSGKETSVNVNVNAGRRVYTPAAALAAKEANETAVEMKKEAEEDESRSLQKRLSKKKPRKVAEERPDPEFNPWLDGEEEEGGQGSSKVRVVDKDSSELQKAAAKIEKHAKKRRARKRGRKAQEDEDFVIEDKQTLNLAERKPDSESEVEEDDDVGVFKQKNLVREAFAGDDVVDEEFDQEKEEVEELEGDKEEVVEELPGWGSWTGGESKRKKKKRKIVRHVQGVVAKNKRLDKGKKDVIINERVNKKAARYLADKVPYPFKTWAQYEKSLKTAIGEDWNSTDSFQKMTMPHVITKYGGVIDPMAKHFKEK